uniref:RRM domain-containing protein n=1 Tax=Ornithorhynchus anatinus TaxID=9258 RepID=A0A6I8MY97_ORNAN
MFRGKLKQVPMEEDPALMRRVLGPEPEPSSAPAAAPEEAAKSAGATAFTVDVKSFLKPGEKTYTQRCRLFVGNLPTDISEENFKCLFQRYGRPREIFISRDRGFSFVHQQCRELAHIAKAELDGTFLRTKPLRIRFATHGADPAPITDGSPYG